MLFTPTGTFYSKVQFKTEEEVEKVVVDNFKLLFGDYSILLPKSLIRTSGGKGAVPDFLFHEKGLSNSDRQVFDISRMDSCLNCKFQTKFRRELAKFNEKRQIFRRENKKLGIESEQLFGNSEQLRRMKNQCCPITTQYSTPLKSTQEIFSDS